MQVNAINRRQMLTGAGLRSGRGLESAAVVTAATHSVAAVQAAPHVAGPADALFRTYLDRHFPAAEHIKLAGVKSLSAIVVHPGGPAIKALALRWTVQTADGLHSEVIFHAMPAYMSKDGVKNAGVARRKLITAGHAVLLTPATVLTSRAYARGYRPNLTKDLHANVRRQFYGLLASKVAPSAVSVSVEGIYYANGKVSGVEGSALHRHLRLLQNAEHDQALSVIRPVREAKTQKVPRKLSQRRFKQLGHSASLIKRDYQHARKVHARRFVKLLRRHGQAALVQHLNALLAYPKIHVGSEQTQIA